MNIKKVDMTVEELKNHLNVLGGRYPRMSDITTKWGRESVVYIPDIDKQFVDYFGILAMKNKQGFIILPLNEDRTIIIKEIVNVDGDWAKQLKRNIEKYKKIIQKCQESVEIMEELVETQKIRLLFEGTEEEK